MSLCSICFPPGRSFVWFVLLLFPVCSLFSFLFGVVFRSFRCCFLFVRYLFASFCSSFLSSCLLSHTHTNIYVFLFLVVSCFVSPLIPFVRYLCLFFVSVCLTCLLACCSGPAEAMYRLGMVSENGNLPHIIKNDNVLQSMQIVFKK